MHHSVGTFPELMFLAADAVGCVTLAAITESDGTKPLPEAMLTYHQVIFI